MDNITNQATLSYNNTTTTSNTVTTQVLSLYSLSATKTTLLDTYTPGQNITYVTRVENNGTGSVYNLNIIDDLSGNLTSYVDGSVVGYQNGSPIDVSATSANGNVTFSVSNVINPNDNVVIVFQTTSPTSNPDTLTNSQTINGNGGAATGQVVTTTASKTVTLGDYVALDITKAADKTSVYSGDTLVYTFQITNNGNESATNVTFSDTFPTNYTVTAISLETPTSSTPVSYDPATYVTNNTLTLPNLTIPVGTSTLTVTGTYTS